MTSLDNAVVELRQGDICELDLFPHWRMDTAFTVSQGAGFTHLQVPAMPKVLPAKMNSSRRLAVVCSYDCDLENPRDRVGVLIAPLFALSSRHAKYSELADSGSLKTGPDGKRYFNYLQYFPMQVEGLTQVDVELGLVDFSAMTSFGKASDAVEFLKARKVSELTDGVRDEFRVKLATFVGRPELSVALQDATEQAA